MTTFPQLLLPLLHCSQVGWAIPKTVRSET